MRSILQSMATQTLHEESGRAISIAKSGVLLKRLTKKTKPSQNHLRHTFTLTKSTKSCAYTFRELQLRQQWSRWLTTGGIPTALTKLCLPMVLALLAALRFLLISFFWGRWCSFAQMGFSLERLTRPRNTMVTNFFIIALLLLQAREPNVTPSRENPSNSERCAHWKSAAEETWEEGEKKKTLAGCLIRWGGGGGES